MIRPLVPVLGFAILLAGCSGGGKTPAADLMQVDPMATGAISGSSGAGGDLAVPLLAPPSR